MSLARRAALLAVCLLPCVSGAWNDTGHMIVADIAWDHMTPKARAVAARLIPLMATERTPDFITAACWADDTKTRENGPWHYIDLYFRADGGPTDLKPDAENAIWAVDRFSTTLKSSAATDQQKAEALRFLIHIVGDLSQPLHCCSRVTDAQPKGDAGVNRFYIEDQASVGGRRPHNLHYLWDDGCGLFDRVQRPLSDAGRAQIADLAKQCLASLTTTDHKAATSVTDPMAWARDGLRKAISVVYQTPENTPPSAAYIEKGKALCRRQVAIAGLRLAKLLNRLIGE